MAASIGEHHRVASVLRLGCIVEVHIRPIWRQSCRPHSFLFSCKRLIFASWQHPLVKLPAFAGREREAVVVCSAVRCERRINRGMEGDHARHRVSSFISYGHMLKQSVIVQGITQSDREAVRQVLVDGMTLIN
ncbi:hypothetical protein D3C79_917330 [compost metagenome]